MLLRDLQTAQQRMPHITMMASSKPHIFKFSLIVVKCMPIMRTVQLVGLPATAFLESLDFDGVRKIQMLLRADLQAKLFQLNKRLPLPILS